MLKNIDPRIPPELLAIMAKMGHGDVLALVDDNYPAYSAKLPVVQMTGIDTTEAAEAIVSLMPLDTFVDSPVQYMEGKTGENQRPVTRALLKVLSEGEGQNITATPLARPSFYAAAREARVVVVCQETRPYGCFLMKKGVWPPLVPE